MRLRKSYPRSEFNISFTKPSLKTSLFTKKNKKNLPFLASKIFYTIVCHINIKP